MSCHSSDPGPCAALASLRAAFGQVEVLRIEDPVTDDKPSAEQLPLRTVVGSREPGP
jgi:hypothetical protein